VVDAFYSLPRGGAEIGGLLLGRFADGRLRITGYAPMACEHATGPSFTLSANDFERLAGQLAEARGGPAERQPVGWYHSHTRSGVFLSDADQELHRHFFPEAWQVALVLRPHTLRPTMAGFFFREPDGSIRGEASYAEFALAPRTAQKVPSGEAPAAPAAQPAYRRRRFEREGPVIDVTAASENAGAAAEAAPEPEPAPPVPLPDFLQTQPPVSHRRAWALLLAVLAAGGGAAGFATREWWLPGIAAFAGSSGAAAIEPLAINAIDLSGQLQIRWRGASIPQGAEGQLEIADSSSARQVIRLDSPHLRAGLFTYARQGQRVDVVLAVRHPDGRQAREATAFLGAPPPLTPNEREQAARRAAGLQSDLDAQKRRALELERSLRETRLELRRQQQRRLVNQDPER
jgi:proteasome lid subunit RPN8/RPN11